MPDTSPPPPSDDGIQRAFEAIFKTSKELTEGPDPVNVPQVILAITRLLGITLDALESQDPVSGSLLRLVARVTLFSEHKL